MAYKTKCKECGCEYKVNNYRKNTTKFCSRICTQIGIARRPCLWGDKIGTAIKAKKIKRPYLSEYNRKHKKCGELAWNWIFDRTEINERRRIRSTKEYGDWKKTVFERDNYTCQNCGQHGGELNADHIKPFALFPESRFDLSNGRTLCVKCHRKTFIEYKNYKHKII